MADMADTLKPTPERVRRVVALVPNAIADDAGAPSQPYRAVDRLAMMERSGQINAQMRQAGERFRERFYVANLDQLKAQNLERPFGEIRAVRAEPLRIERARNDVRHLMIALGGQHSLAGSVVWNIIGLEEPLQRWSFNHHVSREFARGLLIGSLGVMTAYYDDGEAKE
jgi:hypothetical protein